MAEPRITVDAGAFLRAVLAPLPKGEELVASKAFMQQMRADAIAFWTASWRDIDAHDEALRQIRTLHDQMKAEGIDTAGVTQRGLKLQSRLMGIVNELMMRPSPTRRLSLEGPAPQPLRQG